MSKHLDAIQREVFKADAGVKLTFIARDPNNPEADFLMTEDDLDQVAEGRVFGLRATDEGVDVSEVAKLYGGGGHAKAAGFKVPRGHVLAVA